MQNQENHGLPAAPLVTGYVRQKQLVPDIIPFSASALWRYVRAKTFPAPVKLSAGVTAWTVEEVRAWMENH